MKGALLVQHQLPITRCEEEASDLKRKKKQRGREKIKARMKAELLPERELNKIYTEGRWGNRNKCKQKDNEGK